MPYTTTTIKIIAEKLIKNREREYKTVILLGAGVSVTAGIPLSKGIIERIQNDFPAACEDCKCDSYASYMSAISISDRKDIIKDYVAKSKLNAAHLFLSALIRDGYVDRVLTTNFDPLVTKALALENIFPGIYDFAASQEIIMGEAADVSVFHLHGQIDGFVILNTEDEVNKHFEKLRPVFDDSLIRRTIIVVGYSGKNDPVFQHIKNVPQFTNKLIWVGYKDNEPDDEIKAILNNQKQAFYLKGYDADSFFIELTRELKTDLPRIISTPFSYLEEVVNNIAEIKLENKSYDPVEEVKKWIAQAIEVYEHGKTPSIDETSSIPDESIVKMARDAWISKSNKAVPDIKTIISKKIPEEARRYLSYLFKDNGDDRFSKADKLKVESKETKYREAIEYYESAILLTKENYDAWNNCGLALDRIGQLKVGAEAEKLYWEAIGKYNQAVKLKPDSEVSWASWGTALHRIGQLKAGEEAEKLYREAIEKYQKAIELEPDYEVAWSNWGNSLDNIGQLKAGEEAEKLYREAIEKYQKAIELKSDNVAIWNIWGNTLSRIGQLKIGNESYIHFQDALEKLFKADQINPGSGLYDIACVYSLMNKKEEAIKYLLDAYDTGKLPDKNHLLSDSDLKNIIDDPRVQELLAKI